MKMTKKILALMLAITFVFSAFSISAFADDAIESPIIPVGPQQTPWFEYEFVNDNTALVLSGFNYNSNRYNVTVRATAEKDGSTYPVVGIADDVFSGKDIKSLVVEDGVQTVGKNAFANCAKLASVEIASSVTFVDETAFNGTAWLEAQPDGLIYIGNIAYKAKGFSAASVSLKAETASIADGAFRGQTTLEKIYVPATTTIGTEAFAGCTNVTIYCAENSPAHTYAQANEIPFVLIPSLVLKSAPTKLEYYQNDALALDGIELIYITEAGENPVEVTPEMITGYDPAVLGAQTVTITYEGKTVTFDVNVIERPAYVPGDLDGKEGVDMDDAIYLLFAINFSDTYPLNQPADFDGNGVEDMDDAIYLLFHVNFSNEYPLH